MDQTFDAGESEGSTANPLGPGLFPRDLLRQPAAERLAYFQQTVIEHPALTTARDDLLNAIRTPGSWSHILVCGPQGVGKRTACAEVIKLLADEYREELESDRGRVLLPQIEAKAPENGGYGWARHYSDALRALQVPMIARIRAFEHQPGQLPLWPALAPVPSKHYNHSTAGLQDAVESALNKRRPLAFFIFEAQRLLLSCSSDSLEVRAEVIRGMAKRCKVVHVLVGTDDLHALREVNTDMLSGGHQIYIPRYDIAQKEHVASFQSALKTLLLQMPVPETPIELMTRWRQCYLACIGCIGTLKDLLTHVLADGLSKDPPKVTMKQVEQYMQSPEDIDRLIDAAQTGERSVLVSPAVERAWRTRQFDALCHGAGRMTLPGAEYAGVSDGDGRTSGKTTGRRDSKRGVGERRPTRDPVGGEGGQAWKEA